ncbi:MAG: ATP-binding protein [Chloroflexi bacterium]|nr:ATP-binding protein [Chloroflexota bacterium]
MSPNAERSPLPVLLIVNGYAASGKTTLARALSRDLRWPLVAKDEFKELLFDRLGAADYKDSKRLGAAAIEVMFGVARELLVAGTSVIIESPLVPRYDNVRLRALERDADFLTVQVVLTGDPDVLFERYRSRAERGERHPCHFDDDRLSDMHAMLHAPFESLTVSGETLYFDTSRLSGATIAEMQRQTIAVIDALSASTDSQSGE